MLLRLASLIIPVGIAAVVSACGRSGPVIGDRGMQADPAAVCAKSETYAGVKDALTESVQAPPDATPDQNKLRARIVSGIAVSMSQPVLDSYDVQTEKVSCSGHIVLTWPPAVMQEIRAAHLDRFANFRDVLGVKDADQFDVDYDIQPQAGDGKLIYSVADPYTPSISAKVDGLVGFLWMAEAPQRDKSVQDAPLTYSPPGPGLHPGDPPAPDSAGPNNGQQGPPGQLP